MLPQEIFTVKGIQGHVAYPGLALNPIPIMAELIARLSAWTLDKGSEHFEPSTLARQLVYFSATDDATSTPFLPRACPSMLCPGISLRYI